MPLFGDAYMADTRHLSLEEHGAYLSLLMIAWRSPDCALPDDDARLARMLGVTPKKWAKLKPSIMGFWELGEHGWQQKRLLKERRFVAKKSEQNAEAANHRWEANRLKNNGADDADAMRTQCLNDAPPPPPSRRVPLSNDNGEADFWASAKTYLGRHSKNPGALISKWLRENGREATEAAIAAAQVEKAVNPVEYVGGYFRRHSSRYRPAIPI
jgi:uncharacterized protein YdaU (DUF1376 family)